MFGRHWIRATTESELTMILFRSPRKVLLDFGRRHYETRRIEPPICYGCCLLARGLSSHDNYYLPFNRFLNRISNTYQDMAPPPFYGGIIADPMGLGKTLTMIALAATDLEPRSSLITEEDLLDYPSEDSRPSVSATLVIVPQPRRLRIPARPWSFH